MKIFSDAMATNVSDIMENYCMLDFTDNNKLSIVSKLSGWIYTLSIMLNENVDKIDDFFILKVNGELLIESKISNLVNAATSLTHRRFEESLIISIKTSDFIIKLDASSTGKNNKSEQIISAFTTNQTSHDILLDISQGLTQTEIAEKYNVSQPTISRLNKSFLQFAEKLNTEQLNAEKKIEEKLNTEKIKDLIKINYLESPSQTLFKPPK